MRDSTRNTSKSRWAVADAACSSPRFTGQGARFAIASRKNACAHCLLNPSAVIHASYDAQLGWVMVHLKTVLGMTYRCASRAPGHEGGAQQVECRGYTCSVECADRHLACRRRPERMPGCDRRQGFEPLGGLQRFAPVAPLGRVVPGSDIRRGAARCRLGRWRVGLLPTATTITRIAPNCLPSGRISAPTDRAIIRPSLGSSRSSPEEAYVNTLGPQAMA